MGLAEKQRLDLIKARGNPVLRLEFDVFEGNKVSMWTHFDHGHNFADVQSMLFAIRDHLNEFLGDGDMCPFHKSKD